MSDSAEEAAERVRDLVDYIARALVDDPDGVEVTTIEGDRTLVVELAVEPDDLGKVIGREGRTARAIRTLLAASSARHHRRVLLEIVE